MYIIDDLYIYYDKIRREDRKKYFEQLVEQYIKFWRIGSEPQRQKDLLKGLSEEEIIERKIKARINEYIEGKHNSKLDDIYFIDNFKRLKDTFQKYINTESFYYFIPFYKKKIDFSKKLPINKII